VNQQTNEKIVINNNINFLINDNNWEKGNKFMQSMMKSMNINGVKKNTFTIKKA
jgi:hypothetical protein